MKSALFVSKNYGPVLKPVWQTVVNKFWLVLVAAPYICAVLGTFCKYGTP